MVCETIDLIITQIGAHDIDTRLEELLMDGILYAFQEQTTDDAAAVLNAFGTFLPSSLSLLIPMLWFASFSFEGSITQLLLSA